MNIIVTAALPAFEDELKERLRKSYTKKTSGLVEKKIELSQHVVTGSLIVTETNIEFAVSNYTPVINDEKEVKNEA